MPDINHESINQLIGRFYEAALDEKLWPVVIEELLHAVNFDKASFGVFDKKSGTLLRTQMINCAPNVQPEFLEYYHLIDPKVPQFLQHPELKIAYDYQTIPEQEMDHHEYFDWLRRTCDARYHLCGFFRSNLSPGLIITLGMARHARKGHVDQKEIEFFSFLYQHFERALQISFRLGQSTAMANASLQALDTHPVALVLLDRQGQVQFANTAARTLTRDPDGLRLSGHGITLPRHSDQQRLQELITCAIATSMGVGLSNGGMMSVSRGMGRRPLSITVAPLSGTNGLFEIGKPCAIVLIADPEKSQTLPEDHLRLLYGLTKAEAKLAVLLVTGISLEQAAEQLTISRNTVRTELAHIFDKTNTRRQAELVRLLMNSAPVIAIGK
jgi:DNA-binding CsgD family transcriptional regulator/PAS domain-containing protein